MICFNGLTKREKKKLPRSNEQMSNERKIHLIFDAFYIVAMITFIDGFPVAVINPNNSRQKKIVQQNFSRISIYFHFIESHVCSCP